LHHVLVFTVFSDQINAAFVSIKDFPPTLGIILLCFIIFVILKLNIYSIQTGTCCENII